MRKGKTMGLTQTSQKRKINKWPLNRQMKNDKEIRK
jgi:hypothetical protein